jgi:hypothetical protein
LAEAKEAEDFLGDAIEMAEVNIKGARKRKQRGFSAGKVLAFGMMERKERALMEALSDVNTHLLPPLTIKKVSWGSIICADRCRFYDAIMSFGCKHDTINHKVRVARSMFLS